MTTETSPICWPTIEDYSSPYVHGGCVLPLGIRESLNRYGRYGVPTGDFLAAVLRNDLHEAVMRADSDNLAVLPAIVGYVYNALPSDCWGNAELVKAYIEKWFPLSQKHRPWEKYEVPA